MKLILTDNIDDGLQQELIFSQWELGLLMALLKSEGAPIDTARGLTKRAPADGGGEWHCKNCFYIFQENGKCADCGTPATPSDR